VDRAAYCDRSLPQGNFQVDGLDVSCRGRFAGCHTPLHEEKATTVQSTNVVHTVEGSISSVSIITRAPLMKRPCVSTALSPMPCQAASPRSTRSSFRKKIFSLSFVSRSAATRLRRQKCSHGLVPSVPGEPGAPPTSVRPTSAAPFLQLSPLPPRRLAPVLAAAKHPCPTVVGSDAVSKPHVKLAGRDCIGRGIYEGAGVMT